jgi:hypothetical protein
VSPPIKKSVVQDNPVQQGQVLKFFSLHIVSLLIPLSMDKISELIKGMRENHRNIKFSDLCEVCFGDARQQGTSHRIYKTHWVGDPRVNIQGDKGKAKAYQVR